MPHRKTANDRVWAQQVGIRGGRQFYVAPVSKVEVAVSEAAAAHSWLSVYEVVYDGYGLRPYFDLEYDKRINARQQSQDDDLLHSILHNANAFLMQHVGKGIVDYVILDSSSAVKFSAHIILHLEDAAALESVIDAKVVATAVCDAIPAALLQASTSEGQCSIVDLNVYKKNQQMRIMGCVKHGDLRVLKPHHFLQGHRLPSLVETLICQPLQDNVPTINLQHMLPHPVSTASKAASRHVLDTYNVSDALPMLCDIITSALGGCALCRLMPHAKLGSKHPSIFLHTSSTSCSQHQHASNHSVVEVQCSSKQWRLLCRDGCSPGPWQQLHTHALHPGHHCPSWLKQHVDLWCQRC